MTRLGLVQTCTGIDPAANAAALTDAIAALAAAGAEIVFTPEMSNLVDRDRARAAAAITGEGDDGVLAAVRAAAARHGVWVQLGSAALRAGGTLVNRAFLIDAAGGIAARYDKIHLFDVTLPSGEAYRESAAYAPGDRAVVAATLFGRIGMTVCYDVRFPHLYRDLALAGAELIAVPAAFTRPTGAAHWHTLLRARAIETGCFVVAAAQSGEHADGRATYGHSLVVDPWGTVLLDMSEGTGTAIVDIDPAAVAATRARIPSLTAGRPYAPPALTAAPADRTPPPRAPVAQPDRATVS
ncbi:MAG: carbon-nitrogen hydrolase family protein [Sphingomonadaceae bacterium]|nr:carbon-nitrogen hydrolase family protein [Sphingomonadaceae bacterium]